ncbi:MAG: ATP-binding protein [Xanthomonadales bacterium]|nr:ATP-binding protein [Xanthomonadales bacterium]
MRHLVQAEQIGGTGTRTGKTHLATALGGQAITRHGKRVRFYSSVDLVNQLERDGHLIVGLRVPLRAHVAEGQITRHWSYSRYQLKSAFFVG